MGNNFSQESFLSEYETAFEVVPHTSNENIPSIVNLVAYENPFQESFQYDLLNTDAEYYDDAKEFFADEEEEIPAESEEYLIDSEDSGVDHEYLSFEDNHEHWAFDEEQESYSYYASEIENQVATEVPDDIQQFAESLGEEWAALSKGRYSTEQRVNFLLEDYRGTLRAARKRDSLKDSIKIKDETIASAWKIGRDAQMRLDTSLNSYNHKYLSINKPKLDTSLLVSSPLIKQSTIEPVAPLVKKFVEELFNQYKSGPLEVTTYSGHGPYSLDIYIGGKDEKGFFNENTAVNFLLTVDKVASQQQIEWRALYNDFRVIDKINKISNCRRVVFVGTIRENGHLNWHGPAPLILHIHLDIFPKAKTTTSTSQTANTNISDAVLANRKYAQSLGWENYRYEIYQFLGFTNMTPGETLFAETVSKWQRVNGLNADGKLGSKSWELLQKALKAIPLTTQNVGVSLNIDIDKAILRNRMYAQSVGWNNYRFEIYKLLGFVDMSPSESLFAEKVAEWQKKNNLEVDGIIGPGTWRLLSGRFSITTPKPVGNNTGTSAKPKLLPNIGGSDEIPVLGRLIVKSIPRAGKKIEDSYQFTADDALWLARLVKGEAGGRIDLDNIAVIWTMFNRYGMFRHNTNWKSFADFVRQYSTPLQYWLKSYGATKRVHTRQKATDIIVGPQLVYPRDKNGKVLSSPPPLPQVQLKRHRVLQQLTWKEFSQNIRDMIVSLMRGMISSPVGLASEFANTKVYYHDNFDRDPEPHEWIEFTKRHAAKKGWTWIGERKDLNQVGTNAFFIDNRVIDLSDDTVRIVSP